MEIRKLIVWFIVWLVAVLVTIPKSRGEKLSISKITNLPSIKEMADKEVARIQGEKAVLEQLEKDKIVKEEEQRLINRISRGTNRGTFIATAYDLTVASCGKKQSHPAYGITASGYSLVGQDRESAMTIATDPKVIPLGTEVYIEFLDEEWQHWNGIYISRDTGSAIKGKKIDIFYKDTGDSKTDQELWNFGKRKAKVTIID